MQLPFLQAPRPTLAPRPHDAVQRRAVGHRALPSYHHKATLSVGEGPTPLLLAMSCHGSRATTERRRHVSLPPSLCLALSPQRGREPCHQSRRRASFALLPRRCCGPVALWSCRGEPSIHVMAILIAQPLSRLPSPAPFKSTSAPADCMTMESSMGQRQPLKWMAKSVPAAGQWPATTYMFTYISPGHHPCAPCPQTPAV